jgi:nuclear transcription factor Y gamma
LFFLDLLAAENWKIQTLPLARIKKIMKSEEFILQEMEKEKQEKAAEDGQGGEAEKPNVKFMISGEAPVLMSKACELLIKDLSFRAWRHTERNRRRTLQRQDLHAAVGESEVYDFLIDIVPRVTTPKTSVPNPADAAGAMAPTMPPGLPMGGIPTGIPTVPQPMTAAPSVGPPIPAMMDNSMMQQMQQQHHQPQVQQPQHQTQQQQGMVHQFPDQQQQYQNFMAMPPAHNNEMIQGAAPGGAPQVQQNQQAAHWMTQPVPNNGQAPQPS